MRGVTMRRAIVVKIPLKHIKLGKILVCLPHTWTGCTVSLKSILTLWSLILAQESSWPLPLSLPPYVVAQKSSPGLTDCKNYSIIVDVLGITKKYSIINVNVQALKNAGARAHSYLHPKLIKKKIDTFAVPFVIKYTLVIRLI